MNDSIAKETLSRLEAAVSVVAPGVEISCLESSGDSPSVKVDGVAVDLSLSDDAVPPSWLLEASLLRSITPKGFLFLCVANSARSQMGEGVAKLLAPKDVCVQSAGSYPTSVRPEAVKVLSEIGIDTGAHSSKNVNTIDPATVDVVVTLCAEEECPVFLGKAIRLHWGLPDPASARGDEETRLNAFRDARDELKKRLGVVFS